MIGLVLAAQLAAVQALPPAPPPLTLGGADRFLLRRVAAPPKGCAVSGRMETSFEPAALYRRGDRDPKVLVRWLDYPDGRYCLAGAR